ncbi:uncharacterized protein LOC131804354 [Musca domestica]|uniref:Uncharacterized protein LOC131804354 n=1 Tax=Musca domestica TaxID=7370 RepID=A0ABM3VBJ4_MUSDO|nr:uncharacterized protein LOC131804354 [Musca domestica]
MGPYAQEDESIEGSALTKYEVETRGLLQHMEQTMDMMDCLQTEDELDSAYKFSEGLVNAAEKEVRFDSDIAAQWRQLLMKKSIRAAEIRQTQPKKAEKVDRPYTIINKKEIEVPTFMGNISEWESFHDLFKSLVHDAPYYTNVEKMHRLKAAVKGEARRIIQHLRTQDSDYEEALELLKERYENRRVLFNRLVDAILDQPSMDSESTNSVKQMLDTTKNSIQGLKSMKIPLENTATFFAKVILRKFDKNCLRLYEQQIKKPREIQKLEDVIQFLEQQFLALEAAGDSLVAKKEFKFEKRVNQMQESCHVCNEVGHKMFDCRKYLAMTPIERKNKAKGIQMCYFCLNHKTDKKCLSYRRCQTCNGRHHTLLHLNEQKGIKRAETKKDSSGSKATMVTQENHSTVLLATAQVKVRAISGEYVIMRAIIDQGSQVTSVSEEAAQILGLPRIRNNTVIHGLGSTPVGVSKYKVKLDMKPRFLSNDVFSTEALVLPTVMSAQPEESFETSIEEWNNYTLADPLFNKSDRVDLIIGGDLYSEIMEEGQVKNKGPFAQKTKLGWILSGKVQLKDKSRRFYSAVTNLERFWELEEVDTPSSMTIEDDWCMQTYNETTVVEDEGRIVVSLPLKDDKSLGDSKGLAIARLLSIEKKLRRNPNLDESYKKL